MSIFMIYKTPQKIAKLTPMDAVANRTDRACKSASKVVYKRIIVSF